MEITNHASVLGYYALVVTFGIDPTILSVQAAPVAVAVVVAVAISVGGLMGSMYAQIRAMSVSLTKLLKGAKRGMRVQQIPVSQDGLNRKAPRPVIIAASTTIFLYGAVMCWLASSMLEEDVTLTSWALHVGVWGCVVGALGIIWGIWKPRNQVSRRQSKPSNVLRKRLNRVITPGFFAKQQVFAAPWADGTGIPRK